MSEDLNTEAIDRAYRIMIIITDAERRARERKSHAELQAGINATMAEWWRKAIEGSGAEKPTSPPPSGDE